MKKKSRSKTVQSRRFKIDENLKQFFPQTSRMGFAKPIPWQQLGLTELRKKTGKDTCSPTHTNAPL